MPSGVRWSHLWGAGLLGGIGFTMSIFISELGFPSELMVDDAKISIFVASFLSGAAGYVLLSKVLPKAETETAGF